MDKEHLQYILEHCVHSCIMDIGANTGTESALFKQHFATVYAVEPDAACIKHFQARNLQIPLYTGAISDHSGVVLFHPSYKQERGRRVPWNASGSIRKPTTEQAYPWLHFDDPVEVPCTTLDALVAAEGLAPAALHIDIQGAERDLIAGGQSTLGYVQVVNIEVSEEHNYEGAWGLAQISEALAASGLHLGKQFGPDAVFIRR